MKSKYKWILGYKKSKQDIKSGIVRINSYIDNGIPAVIIKYRTDLKLGLTVDGLAIRRFMEECSTKKIKLNNLLVVVRDKYD